MSDYIIEARQGTRTLGRGAREVLALRGIDLSLRRGELTLLGGGRESGGTEIGSPEDFGDTGYRPPAPRSSPSEQGLSDPGGDGRPRPTNIAEQLDDDIPF